MSEATKRLRNHVASYKTLSPHRQNCLDVCDEAERKDKVIEAAREWVSRLAIGQHDNWLVRDAIAEYDKGGE